MEIERIVNNRNSKFPWLWLILGIILIGTIVGVIVAVSNNQNPNSPIPPKPPKPPKTNEYALVASNGSMIMENYPLLSNKEKNSAFKASNYQKFFSSIFTNRNTLPCKDKDRDLLLSYLAAVYYNMNTDNLQKLTTDELTVFYRSLVFYFITTMDKQPDGGWYGDYWKNRIQDQGPYHNKNTGQTNMTATKNESFLFDQIMIKTNPTECTAYQKENGKCPGHAKFWGNRIFPEMSQASMRRGMRNSPQVLAENPSWGQNNTRFGTGGYPSNVYLEMLQFPEEHGAGGWPTGCNASNSTCTIESFSYQGDQPRYQPVNKNRTAGGDPYNGMKPQWFYPSQGLGQFWNIGETSYCFNYVDFLLNAPMNPKHAIGWSNGFGSCSETIKFPPGAGALGYDLEDPTKPTEHDYNDPVYSMLLVLEYESRVDVPGSCKDSTCHQALRDVRTGMSGLGYCAATSDGGKTCACQTSNPECLYQPGPPMNGPDPSKTYGCAPSQPVNNGSRSLNEQVCALMGQKAGTYWEPYLVVENYYHEHSNINSKKGISGKLNQYGGFDPSTTWAKVRRKNNKQFPKRSKPDYYLKDKRYMAVGWINGNFYGYPKGSTIPGDPKGKIKYNNPFAGGVPGLDVDGKTVIYGKILTEKDPLIYLDRNGKELYRTWYNKPLKMSEETALELCAEFYSCGDNGLDQMEMNWPFGTYFGYGQSLGGVGKSAAQAMSGYPYNCTTIQFTNTATAYGSVVQPAYDTEILYMAPVKSSGSSAKCTCATSVTLDLLADFTTEDAGNDLKIYLNRNKGIMGGFVYVNSLAGKTARTFNGSLQKVSNWTTVSDPYAAQPTTNSFDPSKPNSFGVSGSPPSLCGVN